MKLVTEKNKMSKVKKTAETPLVNTDGNEKNQLSGSSAQKEAGGKTTRKKVVKDGVTAEGNQARKIICCNAS